MGDFRWAVGVTTVPERAGRLLPQTLLSLRAAGFERPRLFVDGVRSAAAETHYGQYGLEVTPRWPRAGLVANWLLSLWELYLREPWADRYALFQDDCLAARDLRAYLEASPYPERGYLNLWTSAASRAGLAAGVKGWFRTAQTGQGAVGLVFDGEAALRLLGSEFLARKPRCPNRGHRLIDGGVVEAMKIAGWAEYCHLPSLLAHTGAVSTIAKGPVTRPDTPPSGRRMYPNVLPLDWPGEAWSALSMLACAPPPPAS